MKILVVEDYAPIRRALVKGLSEAAFAVDSAADGEHASWFLRHTPYDVVVLDIMLPKVGGLELLKQLRAAQSPARVLVLTAKDAVADRVAGLNLGADDYLVKPFDFDEL